MIDRALEREVQGVDAERIRDHLSQAMNYTGPDPRETALVRLTAASILGDREGIDRANESLQALDRSAPGGPPRAASDIPTPGRGPNETVGEHIAPQTRSAALTEDWQILDTTFGRLGGRGSATGWVSRTVETGDPVQATAPDGTEREVRLGVVDTSDGATRHVALPTPGSAAHVDLPREASGSREAAERHVAGAIAAGQFPDSRVVDPARDTLTAITNTPTLPGGAADASRVDALWDRYQARNPGYDAIRAGDFMVDIYNRDGATPAERANTARLYNQPEMEPVRILNGTIFGTPDGKVEIPVRAEGGDDVFTAREVAPAFAEVRARFGEAEYQRRVNATAEALYEAGWPLNFGVRDLAVALDRIEAERGPPTLDPAFEATAPRYRP